MPLIQHYRRRGMTLIELLVVISILGLLAVTVLPNLSNNDSRRKVREAAMTISSFIAGGQSRALGSRAGGGVWIDLRPSPIASGPIAAGYAINLADADVPASYAGDSISSSVTFGTASPGASTAAVTFTGGCTPPSGSNNLIRLGNAPALFTLSTVSGSTATVSMRSSANQTASNTSWPRPNSPMTYEIIGPPTRASGNTLTLGNAVAIDLYHSWFQGQSLQAVLGSGTTPFQILFDSTGRPQYVACNGSRQPINNSLYLLVASIESIESTGTSSNSALAPKDGYWVAIEPRGGIPKVTEVYTSGTSLVDQQKYIREGAVR